MFLCLTPWFPWQAQIARFFVIWLMWYKHLLYMDGRKLFNFFLVHQTLHLFFPPPSFLRSSPIKSCWGRVIKVYFLNKWVCKMKVTILKPLGTAVRIKHTLIPAIKSLCAIAKISLKLCHGTYGYRVTQNNFMIFHILSMYNAKMLSYPWKWLVKMSLKYNEMALDYRVNSRNNHDVCWIPNLFFF